MNDYIGTELKKQAVGMIKPGEVAQFDNALYVYYASKTESGEKVPAGICFQKAGTSFSVNPWSPIPERWGASPAAGFLYFVVGEGPTPRFVETIIDDLASEFFPGGVISDTDNEHRFQILKILFEAGKEAKKLSAALKDTMFKNPYFHSLTKREAIRIVKEKLDPNKAGWPPGTRIELLIPCPDNEPDQFTYYGISTSLPSEEPFIIIKRNETFFFDLFFRYLSEEDFISYVLLSDPLAPYGSIGRFQETEEKLKVIESFRLDLENLVAEAREKLKPLLKHTPK